MVIHPIVLLRMAITGRKLCLRSKTVCTFSLLFKFNHFSGVKDWTAGSLAGPEQIQYDSLEKAIVVSQTSGYPVYFYLPDKFLGDLRFAYNQLFGFTLRTMFDSSAVSARFV